jgi:hypothetical protein
VTTVKIRFNKDIPSDLYESYTVTKSEPSEYELEDIEIDENSISFYDSDITYNYIYNIGLYKDYNVSICKELVDDDIYPVQVEFITSDGLRYYYPVKFIDYSNYSVIWGDYSS